MAEGHNINAWLNWRQSPREDALVLPNSTAPSTFGFPTDGHKWRWHRPAWFVDSHLMAKTSEPSLTGTEFDLLSLSLQGKPSLMREFLPPTEIPKNTKFCFPALALFISYSQLSFQCYLRLLTFFPWKITRLLITKIEAIKWTSSSRRDKDHEITLVKEDFYLPKTQKEVWMMKAPSPSYVFSEWFISFVL